MKRCKDCVAEGITTLRDAFHPGPRCATHHRIFTKTRKANNHELMVQRTYKLQPGEYAKAKEFQEGTCAICQLATGKSKRLAVDHDHGCCPETPTCGNCNRGLLCSECNQLLGRAKDRTDFFHRAIRYLDDPPIPRMRRAEK